MDGSLMLHMTDSHFHALEMKNRGLDPSQVLKGCRQMGFAGGVDVGLCPEDLEIRQALLAGTLGVVFSSGLAPAEAESTNWADRIGLVDEQASSAGIVAIGEIGLDWHWNYGTRRGQMELLGLQLGLAEKHNLPAIIHNREADADLLTLLRCNGLKGAGVMHCFSSDYEFAARCLDQGFYISFAGNVTYKNAHSIKETAKKIPLSRMLLETDSPYLSPQAVRGKINTPKQIVYTYQYIADLRGISCAQLTDAVCENFHRVFHLK